MPGFDGTGPAGMGPMTGGGRGFCNPQGVRVAARTFGTFYPQMTREQELEFLKSQAMAMKRQLGDIETRVKELEKK